MTLLLTIPEAAVELRVSRQTVYRRIASGRLQSTDVGEGGRTLMRVPRAALDAYARGETGQATQPPAKRRTRARKPRTAPK